MCTGWTFFTLICYKNWIVCLKRPKINENEAGDGPLEKKNIGSDNCQFNSSWPPWPLKNLFEDDTPSWCDGSMKQLLNAQIEIRWKFVKKEEEGRGKKWVVKSAKKLEAKVWVLKALKCTFQMAYPGTLCKTQIRSYYLLSSNFSMIVT